MSYTVKDRMRHYLNPLHIFCSLAPMMKRAKAMKTAKIYERIFFNNILL